MGRKTKRKLSKKASMFIARTVRKLINEEDYSQSQALAIAYSKARKKGYHVPRRK